MTEVTNPGTISQKWTDYLSVGNAKVGIAQDSATFSKIAAGEPLTVVYPSEGVFAPLIQERNDGHDTFDWVTAKAISGSLSPSPTKASRSTV